MKVVELCVLMAALAGGTTGDLLPPQGSYKILMLLPMSSKSHRNIFLSVAEALAVRGHKVMMLTNHPKASKHPNIYEFKHGLPCSKEDRKNMFKSMNNLLEHFSKLSAISQCMSRDLYKVPEVMELYKKRKDFDLIIVNHKFNEMAYPFVHEMPFITIATNGMDSLHSAVMGNVLNPAYVSNMIVQFPAPMSVWHRFLNTFAHIAFAVYWRNWKFVPIIQKEISAQFPDLPPLLELERNQSLTLLNYHFSISPPLPLLPSQVEVGAIHCRPSQPLPEELKSWISGTGPEGVIYFSLGSVALGNTMPVEYRNFFLEAFRRLPHRVIWKYEGELEGVSDNVLINEWLPQQDILANNNVKVFISHGGLLSLQEAIYHNTPLLVLPIFADQFKNAMFVKTSGLGDMLNWEELTSDVIVDALTEITNNNKYKENLEKMSKPLQDQLMTPQDRAVFWTEYVIRHRGAPHLKSPAAQLSWVEFLMLDVLTLLLVATLIFLYILYRIFRAILVKIFGGGGNKKKLE